MGGKQSNWGRDFESEINKYLAERKVTYDFQWNYFSVEISVKEIETVLKKYDEKMIEIMEHFTNLLTAPCYERRFLLLQKESKRWSQEKIRTTRIRLYYFLRKKNSNEKHYKLEQRFVVFSIFILCKFWLTPSPLFGYLLE